MKNNNQYNRGLRDSEENPKALGTLGSESQTTTQNEFATNDFRISYRLYGFSTSGVRRVPEKLGSLYLIRWSERTT